MSTENETTTTEAKTATVRQMSFTILDDGHIRAEFGPGLDPITLDPQSLPEDIFPHALAEGIISRLRSYASKLSGDERTPAALRDATLIGVENLQAGKWKVERAPGSGSSEVTIEAEAAHVYRKGRFAETNPGEEYTRTLEQDAEDFSKLTDDTKDEAGKVTLKGQKSKLKETQRYQVALATVKAARSAAKAAKLQAKIKAEEATTEAPF